MATNCWFSGLATLDVIHRADRRPGPNEKITASAQYVAAGGPATNAAVTASAMGVSSTLITAVGRSALSQAIRSDLVEGGVRVIDTEPDHEVSVAAVLVDEATGARSVVSTDAGSARAVAPDLSNEATPAAVLLDGHHPDLMRGVLREAKARGALVVLDAGRWRPIFEELIPEADVVACSADFRLPTGERGLAAMRAMGASVAVSTAGAQPVTWFDAVTSGTVRVPRVHVVDTLGAGDVFHGALVAALAGEAALHDAIETAVAVASLRVQHIGPRAFLSQVRATFGATR